MVSIKIGVIPAAGAGIRMGYLGQILPKCLFPLYDKPIIHYIVENMQRVGIEQIFVPVWYQKDKVIQYFDFIDDKINVDIEIIPLEDLPSGLALTIASTEEYINEPFMTILGDDVTKSPSLINLIDAFFKEKAVVVEGVVKEKNTKNLRSTCCVTIGEKNQILEIIEKPRNPTSDIRGCGVYVFSEKIFKYIEKTPPSPITNGVEITDTIGLIANEGKAYAEHIRGVNLNINTYDDLLDAWLLIKSEKRRS